MLLYSVVRALPKHDRHALGQKCELFTLEILELFFMAHAKKNKLFILTSADIKLRLLKTLVRMMHDTKAIDQKKYILLEEFLHEIGRMLGGWIKSLYKIPA